MPKSDNPANPTADPTAPGGMSRKALIEELVNDHGYEQGETDEDGRTDWDDVTWPDLIQLVIGERREREMEVAAQSVFVEPEMTVLSERKSEIVEDDDIDALLAEFEEDGETDIDWPAFGKAMETGEWKPSAEVSEASDTDQPEMLEVDPEWMDPEVMFAEMAQARAADEATKPAPLFLGIPGVKDYVFDGHAGAGPSGAERWMNCTMSLSASRAFLETLTVNQQHEFAKSGTAARQGTTAHSAAEVEANHVLGRATDEEVTNTLLDLAVMPDEGETYDDEMGEYITEYVDLVRSYAQDRGDDAVLIESRVEAVIPLTDMHEGEVYVIHGSADLGVLPTRAEPTLVVGDLKYGNGIDVDVDENPQIREYALGMLALLADENGDLPSWVNKVIYHIVQPRLGGIKTWEESIDDLLTWRDEVLAPALTKALYGADEGATYEPSELACQWCPARGGCPALTKARFDSAGDLFDVMIESEYNDGPGAFPETTTLSHERLGELLTMAAGVKDVYSSLREEAQRRLHRGEEVPGYHLVNYTPRRTWKAVDDPMLALEDAGLNATQVAQMFTEPTLVSPTVAEKVLGKEGYPLIEELVVKPEKIPVISTGPNDRRKAWAGKPPEAMFDAVPEDE